MCFVLINSVLLNLLFVFRSCFRTQAVLLFQIFEILVVRNKFAQLKHRDEYNRGVKSFLINNNNINSGHFCSTVYH